MINWLIEKFNPAQPQIVYESGSSISSETELTLPRSFDRVEVVNRGVSMIVNACASLDYDVKGKIGDIKVREKALSTLLNFRPNPYQSAYEFRQAIFTDFIFDGHVFIHFDGKFMYHVPANKVEILTDKKTFIAGYKYGDIPFKEDEMFTFRDINSDSIYRGASRLISAKNSVNTLYSMQALQKGFFDNGAMFGLILTTDETLSSSAKEKTILHFIQNYSPKKGGKTPVIMDRGLKPHSVANTTFKDMDFDISIKTHSEKILHALGIPPILLAGGNNANIAPNLRLFYLETVLPIIRAYTSALERFYGYDVEAITSGVTALEPELQDVSAYLSTLVNGGVIAPNEARERLRLEPKDGHNDLRIPANIAGSAANPSEGGKPPSSDEKKE